MITKHISITKTARYIQNKEWTDEINTIIFVLHGYGQSATRFLQKFEALDEDNTLILAPEGLHRFYVQGTEGLVGASWMTKEDREKDIKDYVHYLDQLAGTFDQFHANQRYHLIGFSQGAATASRWLALGKTSFQSMTLWCGMFPPDVPLEVNERFNEPELHMIYGDQDEYRTLEEVSTQVEELKGKGVDFTLHEFEGKHEIRKSELDLYRERILNP